MELQSLANLGDFLGGIGVVFSLVYLAFQVRGNTRSQRNDIAARALERLGSMQREMATHLAHQSGYRKKQAPTGTVTPIQRFGSALNLNFHFHMLFLDGVYVQVATSQDRRFQINVCHSPLPARYATS